MSCLFGDFRGQTRSCDCWTEWMLWRTAAKLLESLLFFWRGSLGNRPERPRVLWRTVDSAPRFSGEPSRSRARTQIRRCRSALDCKSATPVAVPAQAEPKPMRDPKIPRSTATEVHIRPEALASRRRTARKDLSTSALTAAGRPEILPARAICLQSGRQFRRAGRAARARRTVIRGLNIPVSSPSFAEYCRAAGVVQAPMTYTRSSTLPRSSALFSRNSPGSSRLPAPSWASSSGSRCPTGPFACRRFGDKRPIAAGFASPSRPR